MQIKDFIGIPYLDGGRDLKGCDCYGLVALYYKHILNIDIPESKITAEQPRRIFLNYLNELSINWRTIEAPVKDCVVAFAYNPNHPDLVTHFGVMIDNKTILHCLGKVNSHISNIDDIRVKPFIKAYHIWKYHDTFLGNNANHIATGTLKGIYYLMCSSEAGDYVINKFYDEILAKDELQKSILKDSSCNYYIQKGFEKL